MTEDVSVFRFYVLKFVLVKKRWNPPRYRRKRKEERTVSQWWRWGVIQQNQTCVSLSPLRPVQTSGGPQRRHQQERSGPSRFVLRPRRLRSVHEADRKQTLLPRRRRHHGHFWGEVMWRWMEDEDESQVLACVCVCVCRWGRCGTWLQRFWVELWTSGTASRRWSRWMFTLWVCSTGRASGGVHTCSQVRQHCNTTHS